MPRYRNSSAMVAKPPCTTPPWNPPRPARWPRRSPGDPCRTPPAAPAAGGSAVRGCDRRGRTCRPRRRRAPPARRHPAGLRMRPRRALAAEIGKQKRVHRRLQQDGPMFEFHSCFRTKTGSTHPAYPWPGSSASRLARVAASHSSKCAPRPSSITSRVIPEALRSSGAIRTRPEPSNSTSCALPSNSRCSARADMGKAAICSRFFSHSGRGYTSRQPSGWRVRVSRPSACDMSASRCRVGIEIRPLASSVSALLP